jgi:hypothetical protein
VDASTWLLPLPDDLGIHPRPLGMNSSQSREQFIHDFLGKTDAGLVESAEKWKNVVTAQ